MNRDDLWSQIRQGLKDGIQYTVQKTEELTRIGRLKLEIASQKRRLARLFGELGARTYALLSEEDPQDPRQDARVRELFEGLLREERRLDGLLEELGAARAAAASEVDDESSPEQVTIRVDEVEDDLFFKSESADKDDSGQGDEAAAPGDKQA
jgi:hypothetical protein